MHPPTAPDEPPAADETDVLLDTLELYREESKAARDKVEGVLAQYRANTSTMLALATAAVAFFGFSTGPRQQVWYIVAMAAYLCAVGLAFSIYAPTAVLVNVAADTQEALFADPDHPLLPEEIQYGYAVGHQEGIAAAIATVTGRFGLANRFRALILAIAVLVVAASASVAFGTTAPATPTRVVIEKGQP